MENIKNTKLLGVIGNILVIVSLFCTWIVVEAKEIGLSGNIKLKETSDGGLTFILSIFSLIVIFAENISPKFFKGLTNIKLTLISAIVELLVILRRLYISINTNYEGISHHFGIGFYLMCIGVVLLLIFPFIYKQENIEK